MIQNKFNKFLNGNIKILNQQRLFGLSNETYLISLDNDQKYVIKIFCNLAKNYKNKKIENFLINNMELYPKIYFTDDECRIEEYIENYQITNIDNLPHNLKILDILAEHLTKLHKLDWNNIDPSHNKITNLEYILSDENYNKLKKITEESEVNYIQDFCWKLLNDMNEVRPILNKYYQKYIKYNCLCHNDINPHNMLFNDNNSFYLLDYEYSNYNNLFYEIGNFFLEIELKFKKEAPYFEYLSTFNEDSEKLKIKKYLVSSYYEKNDLKDFTEEEFFEICDNFKILANFYWLNILVFMRNYKSSKVELDYKFFMGELFKNLKTVIPRLEKEINN